MKFVFIRFIIHAIYALTMRYDENKLKGIASFPLEKLLSEGVVC